MNIGMNLTEWFSDEELENGALGGRVDLGTRAWNHEGKCYVYVKLGTGGVTGDGYVCTIDEDYEAVMLDTSNDADGDILGVAEGAGASGEYGWLQVYGSAGVRSEASALANAFLGATTDDGQVDDAAATGLYIDGIVFRAATPGAAGVNDSAHLNWPRIATRMEPEA